MSFSHLLILGIIAVIVIPPDKLPEVARQVAKFLGDMRRMTSGIFDDLKQDVMLTPEEMLKKKNQQNEIRPPEVVAQPIRELTAEEKKKAEEDYLKHIQSEELTKTEVVAETTEQKKTTT